MHIKNILISLGALCFGVVFLVGNIHAQTKGYHLIKKTVIGGEGGWDYLTVDHEGGRLFLSHGNQVEVRDLRVAVSCPEHYAFGVR